MRDSVEEVKAKSDIVAIIGERVQLSKAGKNFKANCPFHSEKTPSFIVSPDIQFYKCFGCGEHGDVFTFLEKFEGMEFFEALKYLADRAGVKLKSDFKDHKGIKDRLYEINTLVLTFYDYILKSHPEGKKALEYLTVNRGLTAESIKTFNLGYSPDTPFAMKSFILDKKNVDIAELEKTGTIYRNGNYVVDRFRGRIIFPLYDHRGNICGFAGRAVPWVEKTLPPGKQIAKYINTPDTPVYIKSNLLYGLNIAKNHIKKSDYAVIVEGELDMISSWQVGVKNVIAIKGSALTLEQIKLLSRYTKRIILALDSDFAGNAAARRGIEIAEKEGLEIKVVKLGKYKDPDEAARGDFVFYKNAIKNAVSIWDFLIDSVFVKYENPDGADKARISKEVVPLLMSISDKIVQAHYIELVAKRLSIPTQAIYEQIGSKTPHSDYLQEVESAVNEKNNRRQLLEERLISLLIAYDPKLLGSSEYKKYIKHPFYLRISERVQVFVQKNGDFDLPKFQGGLPDELVEGFNDLILKGSDVSEDRPEVYAREIDIVIREIDLIVIREEIRQLTHQLSKPGLENDELEKLNDRFKILTKKLSQLEENNHKGIILVNQ